MRTSSIVRSIVLCAALPLTACTDLSLPDNPLVSCAGDEDCPEPLVCRTQLGRCIDASLLDDEAIGFLAPLVLDEPVRSRVPGYDVVSGWFQLNRQAKSVTLQFDDQPIDGCAPTETDALMWRCEFNLADVPDAAEGFHGVFAIVEDELGNRARAEFAVRFDFTPPGVPEDTVWLRLRPGPRSAISDIDAIGDGARAELQFVVTEQLGPMATVAATNATAAADFTRNDVSSIGVLELHELTVTAGAVPDGTYDLEVTLEDPVGNAAVVTLADPLIVDTTAPAAPANAPDQLSVERAPWGTDDSVGAPAFHVTVAAGAVEGDGVVIITSGPDDSATELGRAPAAADGSAGIDLSPQDYARYYARVVDGAGNLGPTSLVRGVVWRATLGRKVAGETFTNPHTMLRTGRLIDVINPPDLTEVDDAALTGALPGDVLSTTAGAWRREAIQGVRAPDVLDTAAVYDRTAGRTLLFGGGGTPYQSPSQMMWERTGGSWRSLDLDLLPPPRRGHSMVWDPTRGRAVLFGGHLNDPDTWVFDGTKWTDITAPDGPPSRVGAAMAWDPIRDVAVLFGGAINNTETIGDTWELVGDVWLERFPAMPPSSRVGHAMAWDDEAGHVVLFGGSAERNDNDSLAPVYSDTRAWDGAEWTPLTFAGPRPSGRWKHTLTADEARGVLVLTGGLPTSCGLLGNFDCLDGPEDRLGDIWEWDGTAWRARTETLGDGVAGHAAFYDPALGAIVVMEGWYGDTDLGGARPESRLYEDSTRGFVRRLQSAPLYRQDFAFAYDEGNQRFVAHGGAILGGAATGNLPDLFHYENGTWTEAWNGSPPGGRMDHAMVYVPGSGSVMLGSTLVAESTWRWTGVSWRGVNGITHPTRLNEAMAYDASRSQIVLFGGHVGFTPSSQTWLHNGADWALQSPAAAPSARFDHAMAYDAARGVIVLFGGYDGTQLLDDTWEWDGTTWRDATAADGPAARATHRMAWDPIARRVLLYGGDALVSTSSMWAWDGLGWSRVATGPTDPGPRRAFGMGWDTQAKRLHAFSGAGGIGGTVSDHWVLEPGNDSSAAIVARFAFAASGAPSDVLPTRTRIRAIAGGTSTASDMNGTALKTGGVSLRVWQGGRWRELSGAAHPGDAPGLIEATSTDVASWIGGEGRPVHFAVTTTEPGGPTAADGTRPGVVVEYLELELTYELP